MIKNFSEFVNETVVTDKILDKASKDLGIDISKFDRDQLRAGYNVELEHGKEYPETNVTNDDPSKTLKIVLAHLNEDPTYYTKLNKMEKTFNHNV